MLTEGEHTNEKIKFYNDNINVFPYWDPFSIIYRMIELDLCSKPNLDFIDHLFLLKKNKSIYNDQTFIYKLLKTRNLDTEVIDHIITKSFDNLKHNEKDRLLNFYFKVCVDKDSESLIEKILIKTSKIVGYLYESKSPELVSMVSYKLIDIETLDNIFGKLINWNHIIFHIFDSHSYKKEIYDQLSNIVEKYDIDLSSVTTRGKNKKEALSMLFRINNIKKVID